MHKVRFMMLVTTSDGVYHLFCKPGHLPIEPFRGLYLNRLPDIPNATGPDAGFDNQVIRVVVNGPKNGKPNTPENYSTDVLLMGLRRPTHLIEEVQKELGPRWSYQGPIEGDKIRHNDGDCDNDRDPLTM